MSFQMLQFDPRKRISVQDTLEHPYLATYHDAANEPVAKTIFKADFESIEMDKQKLRRKYLLHSSAVCLEMQPQHSCVCTT